MAEQGCEQIHADDETEQDPSLHLPEGCASQDPGNTIQSKHDFADPSMTLLLSNEVNGLQELEGKLTTEKLRA